MKCFEKHVGKFCFLIVSLCVFGIARAQSPQPWDTNILNWTLPTNCSTGEPVSACPLTGIRVEESSAAVGTYSTVTTLPATATTYTITGVSAGAHFYRVIALSAVGNSAPSNIASKTNVKPVGPPNAPVLRVISDTAFNLRMDGKTVVLGDVVGKATLGALCGSQQIVKNYGTVARSNVRLSTPQPTGTPLMARCDPS